MREFVLFSLFVLVELVGLAEGSQQCRLTLQLQNSGHDQIPINPSTNPVSILPSATTTSSSATTPSPTPFKYGSNTIRGVNLYVISWHIDQHCVLTLSVIRFY